MLRTLLFLSTLLLSGCSNRSLESARMLSESDEIALNFHKIEIDKNDNVLLHLDSDSAGKFRSFATNEIGNHVSIYLSGEGPTQFTLSEHSSHPNVLFFPLGGESVSKEAREEMSRIFKK